jgi:hypothetical protein
MTIRSTLRKKMKMILVASLLFAPIIISYGQVPSNKDLMPDFLYGTWTDSTKTGMTLGKDKEFLVVETTPGSGFEDPRSIEGVTWTYNLFLNKTPIVIEILCNHCDNKPVPKKIIGHIEIINSHEIYITTIDSEGQEGKKIRLTKN